MRWVKLMLWIIQALPRCLAWPSPKVFQENNSNSTAQKYLAFMQAGSLGTDGAAWLVFDHQWRMRNDKISELISSWSLLVEVMVICLYKL